jgi:hypothetical protein
MTWQVLAKHAMEDGGGLGRASIDNALSRFEFAAALIKTAVERYYKSKANPHNELGARPKDRTRDLRLRAAALLTFRVRSSVRTDDVSDALNKVARPPPKPGRFASARAPMLSRSMLGHSSSSLTSSPPSEPPSLEMPCPSSRTRMSSARTSVTRSRRATPLADPPHGTPPRGPTTGPHHAPHPSASAASAHPERANIPPWTPLSLGQTPMDRSVSLAASAPLSHARSDE